MPFTILPDMTKKKHSSRHLNCWAFENYLVTWVFDLHCAVLFGPLADYSADFGNESHAGNFSSPPNLKFPHITFFDVMFFYEPVFLYLCFDNWIYTSTRQETLINESHHMQNFW